MGNIIEAIIYFILVIGVGIFAIRKWGINRTTMDIMVDMILNEMKEDVYLCEFMMGKLLDNPNPTNQDVIDWYKEWFNDL